MLSIIDLPRRGEGGGGGQKILEDPLSIERLKGVKTLCTFNVMNCVRKDSFVFVVQKGFMTIKEDFA